MKTGNKTQAVVLSFVAVLAIGFLVYQLLPSKVKPSIAGVAQTGSSVAPSATADVSQELPLHLIGNPFSHPKLATHVAPAERKAPPPLPVGIDKSGSFTPVLGEPSATGGTAESGSQPAESAGNTRLKQQEPRIKLTAIMRVGDPVAMLEVDNRPGKAYGEGDLLANRATLVSIGDGAVTVRINGVPHEIALGHTYGSNEGQTK